MCGLTHIESRFRRDIHTGTNCTCGFRTIMHVHNPNTKQMEPAVPAYIVVYFDQENSDE